MYYSTAVKKNIYIFVNKRYDKLEFEAKLQITIVDSLQLKVDS